MLSISPATVRRWANAGLLPYERTTGGHRRFSSAVAERLARRSDAQLPGTDAWIRLLTEPGPPLAVDAALLGERSASGGWYVVAHLVGQVLVKLGTLWQRGDLTVLDICVASSRLERALARAAEALPVRAGAPCALLAAAEGDDHTLGLSCAELVVREWGWRAEWIGAGVPTTILARDLSKKSVDILLVSASEYSEGKMLATVASELSEACAASAVDLILGGRGPWPERGIGFTTIRTFEKLRVQMARIDSRRVSAGLR